MSPEIDSIGHRLREKSRCNSIPGSKPSESGGIEMGAAIRSQILTPMTDEIDSNKVKDFWDKRAEKLDPITAITLSDNYPIIGEYRDKTEKRHIFRIVELKKNMTVLDLGCGTGRWCTEFAKRCSKVVGVDISKGLLDIAEDIANKNNLSNIEFIQSSITDFISSESFDIIFIGSVLNYLNDDDIERLIKRCYNMLNVGGVLITRDSVSLSERLVISRKFDEEADTTYQSIYRRPEQYIDAFSKHGFDIKYQRDSHPAILPFSLYKLLVPNQLKQKKHIISILGLSLIVQSYLDPLLIRIGPLTRMHHYRILKSGHPIIQQFFVYEKREVLE